MSPRRTCRAEPQATCWPSSILSRLRRILARMLDEREFLSPYGVRALSAVHRLEPFTLRVDGLEASVDYEPGESHDTALRWELELAGPGLVPLNYLLIESLERFADYLGDDFTVEHPTGSGRHATLRGRRRPPPATHHHLPPRRRRASGRLRRRAPLRPPAWRDLIPFHEYFHADSGKGLGASHQTGWTGLVADLLLRP